MEELVEVIFEGIAIELNMKIAKGHAASILQTQDESPHKVS